VNVSIPEELYEKAAAIAKAQNVSVDVCIGIRRTSGGMGTA
jgi:hypothetical protein